LKVLEDVLPKDNESVFPGLTTDEPEVPAPLPFDPAQMVRCDECLRANPPTRVNCLYCEATLPLTEATATLQRPSLRPLEKWEQGYNNILLPSAANAAANVTDETLREAADLLRLSPAVLTTILSAAVPLPVARAATRQEAELIERRLGSLGLRTIIFVEALPDSAETVPLKVRSLEMNETQLFAFQTPDAAALEIPWSEVVLLVVGRIIVKRIEWQEEVARAENRIMDTNEFTTDETVVECYASRQAGPFRIAANSFDFSCLGAKKGLVAGENLAAVISLLREHAPLAKYDDTFNSVRRALDAVWPPERQSAASGWRRERPGKYSVGSVSELSNEMQFRRYSQLRFHCLQENGPGSNDQE
jgi:hypothetical protein